MRIFYHPHCLKHTPPEGHPERPARVETLAQFLDSGELREHLDWVQPGVIDPEQLNRLHDRAYIEHVRHQCGGLPPGARPKLIDGGDTYAVGSSFRAASLAVGGAFQAVDEAVGGTHRKAFIAMRPPGHHALAQSAMGFCFFGTIALAAHYALEHYDFRRVLIVDFDVHHGNGTQSFFYNDRRVLFFSIHQSHHWPYSGKEPETGEGEGRGYTINHPMPVCSTIKDYEQAFRDVLQPRVEAFEPDLVLVSAGFDAHRLDPLGGVDLGSKDFGLLTRMIRDWAERFAEGRMIAVLEGGYHLEATARSAQEMLKEML